jgi:molecular chaperone GrpE
MSGDFPMDADTTPAETTADQTVSTASAAPGDTAAPGAAAASGESAGSEAGTASSDDDRASRLAAELAALRADYENLNGQYMRLAADFDNYRKRQSRDNEDQRLQIVCSTLSEILPVVDNFDRARQQLNPQHEEAQTLHRSYQGLYKQLVEVFKQLGVSPMRAEGEPFDPNLHEAVLREESHAHPEDIVIEELQRGYVLNDRVIRHALVKVSMGPGPGEARPDPEAAAESAGSQPGGEEQGG